jgi:hypothetical protein
LVNSLVVCAWLGRTESNNNEMSVIDPSWEKGIGVLPFAGHLSTPPSNKEMNPFDRWWPCLGGEVLLAPTIESFES